MAIDFDQPPVYNPIGQNGVQLESVWANWFASFFQTLISYISAGGLIAPSLSQAEIDALENNVNGQQVFNTDIQLPQVFINGVWKTFTVT